MFLCPSKINKNIEVYLFREREREEWREKERQRNINVWLPLQHPPTGDLAHDPGMCPDRESNQQPFGSGWCLIH